MAKVFKKQTTIWKLAGRKVAAGTPGAEKVVIKSGKWYGTVNGRHVPLCRDKQTAERMLRKLEADAALAGVGLADPFAVHKKRPLAEHLDDFEQHLGTNGSVPKHVEGVIGHVRAVVAACNWTTLGDLAAGPAENWLNSQRGERASALPANPQDFQPKDAAAVLGVSTQAVFAAITRLGLPAGTGHGKARRIARETVQSLLEHAARGLGPTTRNYYRRHLKQFGAWLVRDRRMGTNPFGYLEPERTDADQRHRRRAATVDELTQLIDSTRRSLRTFRGLCGADRAMLYMMAFATGFRAAGLASLTPAHFRLDADPPTVTLAARDDKSRKGKVNPLPLVVAADLRLYLASRSPDCPIWSGSWVDDAADMVRGDLAEAGLEGVGRDADGLLFLDFHAIGRHTFLTHIARNAPLHVAQKLAGHSSPVVTARYTHAATDDLRAAVEGLPNVMGDSRSVCTQFARTLCKSGHRESSPDADKGVGGVSDESSEVVAARDVVTPCPPESSPEPSTPGGNRTHNRQLRRLLLYPVELQARLSGLFQPPRVAARDLVEGLLGRHSTEFGSTENSVVRAVPS